MMRRAQAAALGRLAVCAYCRNGYKQYGKRCTTCSGTGFMEVHGPDLMSREEALAELRAVGATAAITGPIAAWKVWVMVQRWVTGTAHKRTLPAPVVRVGGIPGDNWRDSIRVKR